MSYDERFHYGDLSNGGKMLLELLYDKTVYVWKNGGQLLFGEHFPFRDDTAFVYEGAHLNELLSMKFVVAQLVGATDDIILQVQVTMSGGAALVTSGRLTSPKRQVSG